MEIELKHYLLKISLEKFGGIIGLSSKFNDKLHNGFIDCDNMSAEETIKFAEKLQNKYKLGTAYILNAGKPDSNHIYFLDLKPLMFWVGVCLFNRKAAGYGIIKGEFVIRISDKDNRSITFIKEIPKISANKKSENLYLYLKPKYQVGELPDMETLILNKTGLLYHFYNARVKIWK